jgi:AraC-like DNA-binding protein
MRPRRRSGRNMRHGRIVELHDLVLQQAQGPTRASLGRLRARQCNQLSFLLAVKNPRHRGLLIAYCEEAISRKPAYKESFRARVENAMVPLLPHGKARAGEIARRLGTSQRTLARRLSLEGLTFSDVLEGLRSDLAKRYLADKDLSISEVAWLLGYREVSAFTHACRRWTGQTPRDIRSRIA